MHIKTVSIYLFRILKGDCVEERRRYYEKLEEREYRDREHRKRRKHKQNRRDLNRENREGSRKEKRYCFRYSDGEDNSVKLLREGNNNNNNESGIHCGSDMNSLRDYKKRVMI